MKMNNGVEFKQVPLGFDKVTGAPNRYQVLPDGERWVVGRIVHGTKDTYDVVDSTLSRGYAEARAEALNSGRVKA